jgi:hypothetical protein
LIFFIYFKSYQFSDDTMKSWASIAKTAPAAPASTTAQQQQQQGDIFILLPPKIQTKKNASGGDCAQPQQKQQKQQKEEEKPAEELTAEPIKPIEHPHPQPQHDDDPNSFPAHVSLTRPGAPTVAWYVSPAYLKNMKRFEFIFEENPRGRTDYDSDDWFGDW